MSEAPTVKADCFCRRLFGERATNCAMCNLTQPEPVATVTTDTDEETDTP